MKLITKVEETVNASQMREYVLYRRVSTGEIAVKTCAGWLITFGKSGSLSYSSGFTGEGLKGFVPLEKGEQVVLEAA